MSVDDLKERLLSCFSTNRKKTALENQRIIDVASLQARMIYSIASSRLGNVREMNEEFLDKLYDMSKDDDEKEGKIDVREKNEDGAEEDKEDNDE